MIKVVCGIVHKENKILICRRKPQKRQGGYWEFPGGKVECQESPSEALYRELKEELDMIVTIEKYYKTVIHQYEDFTIELIAYVCKFENATFNMIDHDSFKWIEISEVAHWDFAPADILITKDIIYKGLYI